MLPTSWPKRLSSSDYSNERHVTSSTVQRIAQALHEGEDVIQCAGEFGKDSLIVWVNGTFDSDITNYDGPAPFTLVCYRNRES